MTNVTARFTGTKISRLAVAPDLTDSQTATFFNYLSVVSVIQGVYEARARGDGAGSAVFFAEPTDFVGEPDCTPCTARDRIAARFQRQYDQGTRFTARDIRVSGTTATWVQEVRGPNVTAFGIERFLDRSTGEVRDGKITLWRSVNDLSDPATAAFAEYQAIFFQVQRMYMARNRGDAAAAVQLFAEPADFAGGNCRPCSTRAGIQAQFENQFNADFRWTISDVRQSGSTVSWVQAIRSPAATAAGIERRISRVTAEFRDGKIVHWRAVDDLSDPQTAAFFAQNPAPPPSP